MASMTPNNQMSSMGLVEVLPRHWRWSNPERAQLCWDPIESFDHARWMRELATLPPGRQVLVERIRSEIAAGTYESVGKFDVAIDRLAADLGDPAEFTSFTR